MKLVDRSGKITESKRFKKQQSSLIFIHSSFLTGKRRSQKEFLMYFQQLRNDLQRRFLMISLSRFMLKLGLEAIYYMPCTSLADDGHRKYPYLLAIL